MLRLMMFLLLQLCTVDFAMAAESAYVPTRRFMPLPPPKANLSLQQEVAKPPAKFFPLTQTRYPLPIRFEKASVASGIVNSMGKNNISGNNIMELPSDYLAKSGAGKKINMSKDDAEQIISIFGAIR